MAEDDGEKLRGLTHDLIERIKELNCLYGISRLVEKREAGLDEILEGVVELIPPAWQYPETACACIRLKNKLYQSANFHESRWRQIEPIAVNGRASGTVEVYYLEEKPECGEGPFLKEERDLIHSLAERLSHIIESKKAEAALRKLYTREKNLRQQLQLEMQNRIDFTRQLIHELKTPLTSLLATSQLLLEETSKSKLENLSRYVYEGANILNQRVDELHDAIKGEIGKLNLTLKPVNIEGLLWSVVEENQPLAQRHGVELKFQESQETAPEVLADIQRLRQIMFNLINNACKYAAEGKLISVRSSLDPASRAVIVEVADRGPGIPREKRRTIFQPGYKPIADLDQPGGLGIGLPLCRVLVELHGGKIWLESSAGKGARFCFTIPIKTASGQPGQT